MQAPPSRRRRRRLCLCRAADPRRRAAVLLPPRPGAVRAAVPAGLRAVGDKLRLQSTLEVREAVERRVLALKAQVEAVASA